MSLRVYIGHDAREQKAFDVAMRTAQSFGCTAIPLYEEQLRTAGLLTRPVDTRGHRFDLISSQPQSTQFALARFWVPILAHSGWALFTDCDMVFLRDPHELLLLARPDKAVQVVKHPPLPATAQKMDGQYQIPYERKNWSSVCLWNCDHPANRRLNLTTLNSWHRRDLHGFRWLHDEEIGELPAEWNWLVGVQPKPADPAIAHYTLGTPDMAGHENDPHAALWMEVSER